MSKHKYIKLSLDQISKQLSQITPISNGWKLVKDSVTNADTITRSFQFKSFEDTWAFLTKVAMRSHISGHHPKIITVYNKVELMLSTHDINGLSEIDLKLAKRFSDYASKIGEK